MVLLLFFITHLIFPTVLTNSDIGYCEKSDKTCTENSPNFYAQKYLFYDVNPPEGFNLRRDVYMRFAIMLAEARKSKKNMDWSLVLPPWYSLYHWQYDDRAPLPWSQFFDLTSLKTYAPVVELHELLGAKKLEIDHLYVLQNFPNAFEDGDFSEKWQISDSNCKYNGFWGNKNITAKEITCVRFQGKASQLWEVLNLHKKAKYVMVAHGEIVLHDYYSSKQFWECRKSMKFSKKLVTAASKYIEKFLDCSKIKCDTYIGVHWRRGDFARSRPKDVPSITGTAKQLHKIIENKNVQKIFIATDAWENEKQALQKLLQTYEVYFYTPTVQEFEAYKEGGIAIVEQIIASHASYFVGTHESTFTFRIQEEREILGFPSETTFNRLCPDTGYCEKPSKWTIIN